MASLPTLRAVWVNAVFRESIQHDRERKTSPSQACTSSLTGDVIIHYCFWLGKKKSVGEKRWPYFMLRRLWWGSEGSRFVCHCRHQDVSLVGRSIFCVEGGLWPELCSVMTQSWRNCTPFSAMMIQPSMNTESGWSPHTHAVPNPSMGFFLAIYLRRSNYCSSSEHVRVSVLSAIIQCDIC